MRDIHDIIDNYDRFSTVIIVGRDGDIPKQSITILTDAGLNVLGPVDSPSQALAMVSQAGADVAVISPRLADSHEGVDLIRKLEADWGVPSATFEMA